MAARLFLPHCHMLVNNREFMAAETARTTLSAWYTIECILGRPSSRIDGDVVDKARFYGSRCRSLSAVYEYTLEMVFKQWFTPGCNGQPRNTSWSNDSHRVATDSRARRLGAMIHDELQRTAVQYVLEQWFTLGCNGQPCNTSWISDSRLVATDSRAIRLGAVIHAGLQLVVIAASRTRRIRKRLQFKDICELNTLMKRWSNMKRQNEVGLDSFQT